MPAPRGEALDAMAQNRVVEDWITRLAENTSHSEFARRMAEHPTLNNQVPNSLQLALLAPFEWWEDTFIRKAIGYNVHAFNRSLRRVDKLVFQTTSSLLGEREAKFAYQLFRNITAQDTNSPAFFPYDKSSFGLYAAMMGSTRDEYDKFFHAYTLEYLESNNVWDAANDGFVSWDTSGWRKLALSIAHDPFTYSNWGVAYPLKMVPPRS